MRKAGNYSLTELVSDIDGTPAYVVTDPDTAGSWERALVEPDPDITWVATEDDHDSDDLDISITPAGLSALVARGRVHCSGCNGACGR